MKLRVIQWEELITQTLQTENGDVASITKKPMWIFQFKNDYDGPFVPWQNVPVYSVDGYTTDEANELSNIQGQGTKN